MRSREIAPLTIATVAYALGAAGPRSARADYFDDTAAADVDVESPERTGLEFRVGPSTPETATDAFDSTFNDSGPLLAAEVDGYFDRIPYVGLVGLGFGAGVARFTASAFETATHTRVTEKTRLLLVPLTGVLVLRIDALARVLDIPLIVTGKAGLDGVFWDANTGRRDDAANFSYGLRWAVQGALELDFFDRHAARSLDEEWGINHTFLFAEYFDSKPNSTLLLHDRTWSAGLGFIL